MWLIGAWVFPVISACMWLAMLITMLVRWSITGKPHYPSMEQGQTIAYISDVGAYQLKPLFITGAVITTIFLDLGFISERWLRHTGRLARNTSMTQKVMSFISIVFAIIGTVGLICLSIFDTYHHPRLHDVFLLLFIVGYVVSAIFLCAEYQRLGIHYRNHRVLRISFWVKLAFILVEVAFAIVFGVTSYKHVRNVAAIFEWIIAFVFTFYVLSFVIDLLPSVRTRRHVPQGLKEVEMGRFGAHAHHTHQGGVEYEQPYTTDSAGPNNENVNAGTTTYGGYRGAQPVRQKQYY